MSDLTKLTLVESVKYIKEKKCSATELITAYVKRIEKSDKLNCFNTKDLENAVNKAKKIDANNKLDKALVGAPIAVKDLFCTKGVKTTASSKILSNFLLASIFLALLTAFSKSLVLKQFNLSDFSILLT